MLSRESSPVRRAQTRPRGPVAARLGDRRDRWGPDQQTTIPAFRVVAASVADRPTTACRRTDRWAPPCSAGSSGWIRSTRPRCAVGRNDPRYELRRCSRDRRHGNGAVDLSPAGLLGEATMTDGLAYVIDSSGVLHVIDVATGSERWQSAITTDAEHVAAGFSAPTAAGDAIYVLVGDGSVIGLDRATGDVRWDVPIANGVGIEPAFRGGRPGLCQATGSPLRPADGVIVWAIRHRACRRDRRCRRRRRRRVRGGRRSWRQAARARCQYRRSTVDRRRATVRAAVAGSIAVSGSPSGAVVGLDTATGTELWRHQMSGASRPATIADGGRLHRIRNGSENLRARGR